MLQAPYQHTTASISYSQQGAAQHAPSKAARMVVPAMMITPPNHQLPQAYEPSHLKRESLPLSVCDSEESDSIPQKKSKAARRRERRINLRRQIMREQLSQLVAHCVNEEDLNDEEEEQRANRATPSPSPCNSYIEDMDAHGDIDPLGKVVSAKPPSNRSSIDDVLPGDSESERFRVSASPRYLPCTWQFSYALPSKSPTAEFSAVDLLTYSLRVGNVLHAQAKLSLGMLSF
jgi:hypothetical protein